MSIYHKGNLITSKYNKGEKINKSWRKGHLVFSKPLYNFLSNIKQMGFVIDEAAYSKAYYSMDSSVLNSAKVILLPFVSDTGVVYGMDNTTGDVIPFTFSRATGATLFDKDKNMQLVGNDIPRIDYGNYSDSAKLLIEKESTNYVRDNDFNLGLDIVGAKYTLIDDSWKGAVLANKAAKLVNSAGSTSFYYKRYAKPIDVPLTYSLFYRNDEETDWSNGTTNDGTISISNAAIISSFKSSLFKEDIYRIVGTYSISALSYFGFAKQTSTLARNSYVIGYQVEDGDAMTSYIPTSGSQVTRSADLLSINLQQASSVYLKTTKQETTLSKPVGIWNIDEDLNNEGIEVLAIM